MACLQIYRELLSSATFLRVHSNSKEVSCLSWKNKYPNLKSTSHNKPIFFLWTKLLENLLFAKYLISVAVPLTKFNWKWLYLMTSCNNQILQRATSDFLQRTTSVMNNEWFFATSNERILEQVTSEFLQRVVSKFYNE